MFWQAVVSHCSVKSLTVSQHTRCAYTIASLSGNPTYCATCRTISDGISFRGMNRPNVSNTFSSVSRPSRPCSDQVALNAHSISSGQGVKSCLRSRVVSGLFLHESCRKVLYCWGPNDSRPYLLGRDSVLTDPLTRLVRNVLF